MNMRFASLVSEFASLFGKLGESVDEIFEEIGNCLSDNVPQGYFQCDAVAKGQFFKFPKMNRIQIPKGTNKRRTFASFQLGKYLEEKKLILLVTKVCKRKE